MKKPPASEERPAQMAPLPETAIPALERSVIYRGFADAFRDPAGGAGILDEGLVRPPGPHAQEAFTAAFDPAVSGAACSLHESSYIKRAQSDLFIELVRWYDHFSLRRRDTAELPDHVSVELEFMHFLTFQEHENRSDEAAIADLRRAQKDFLERHLVPFAGAIQQTCPSNNDRCADLVAALPQFLADEMAVLNAP